MSEGVVRSALGLFEAKHTRQVLARLLDDLRQNSKAAEIEALVAPYLSTHEPDIDDDVSRTLSLVAEWCWRNGHWRELRRNDLLYPAYDPATSYATNLHSPWGPDLRYANFRNDRKWTVLGRTTSLPIGVPASVLTANSDWILYWAQSGYNILTYKSVRPSSSTSYPPPNWHFARSDLASLDSTKLQLTLDPNEEAPWLTHVGLATSVNSYGMQSPEPAVWQRDVERALGHLSRDQLLIVSVVGDCTSSMSPEKVASSYADAARMAEEVGSTVIELNVSSPTSISSSGQPQDPICADVEMTRIIVDKVRALLSPTTQIVLKLSAMGEESLRRLLSSVGPQINAIAAINAIPVKPRTPTGQQFFPGREIGGMSGHSIRREALTFAQTFSRVRIDCGLDIELIGIGGVASPNDMLLLFENGASAVQSATGAALDPSLALRCHEQIYDSLPSYPGTATFNSRDALEQYILSMIEANIRQDRSSIAAELASVSSLALEILDELVTRGTVRENRSGDLELVRAFS